MEAATESLSEFLDDAMRQASQPALFAHDVLVRSLRLRRMLSGQASKPHNLEN